MASRGTGSFFQSSIGVTGEEVKGRRSVQWLIFVGSQSYRVLFP